VLRPAVRVVDESKVFVFDKTDYKFSHEHIPITIRKDIIDLMFGEEETLIDGYGTFTPWQLLEAVPLMSVTAYHLCCADAKPASAEDGEGICPNDMERLCGC